MPDKETISDKLSGLRKLLEDTGRSKEGDHERCEEMKELAEEREKVHEVQHLTMIRELEDLMRSQDITRVENSEQLRGWKELLRVQDLINQSHHNRTRELKTFFEELRRTKEQQHSELLEAIRTQRQHNNPQTNRLRQPHRN